MSAIPSSAETDLRRTADEFLDLVCADEDLLRAEFDAIIDATWSPPPARPPASPSRADRPSRRDPDQPRTRERRHIEGSEVEGVPGTSSACQRSPP